MGGLARVAGAVEVARLYDEGYTFVVKLVYDGSARNVLEKVRRLGTGRGSLKDLINKIIEYTKPLDVRASISFAAVDWHSPTSWGSYSWPLKTLEKAGILDREGFYRPVTLSEEDIVARALPTLYKGVGVAVVGVGAEAAGGSQYLVEDSRPALVFVDEGREPKRAVILVVERGARGLTSYALTSTSEAVEVLREHGFGLPEEVEPLPGFKVYKMSAAREFASWTELTLFARRLADALSKRGIALYKHDEVGLERGLPEEAYLKAPA